ncbi:MAG: putative bifunctional diguanylate cyclase/phosphodiesterase [Rectinemataceae bacterium]
MEFDDTITGPEGMPIPRGVNDAFGQRDEEAYRATIARRILLAGLVLGTILIFPTVFIAFRNADHSLMVFDGSVYFAFVVVALIRKLSSRLLYVSLVGLGGILGLFLALHYESGGTGDVWMLTAAVLATLFFGGKGGLLACLLMSAAYGASLLAGCLGFLAWRPHPASYALHGLNVVGLSSLSCFAIARLLEGLHGAIKIQRSLSNQLRHRQRELEQAAVERVTAEKKAEYLQNYDRLTSLPNRDSFRRELERALAGAERRGAILAIMAIGLDRFRRLNEARGSAAADAILTEVAVRLSRGFRQGDFVGRVSDDTFVVFFTDIKNQEDVSAIIEKGRRVFDRSFSAAGVDLAVSASFGIALYPNDGRKAEDLMRAAESALHTAKDEGPGSYRVFDAVLYARLLDRLTVEHEIGEGVRRGAFEPWFQPKVDCLGRVIGAEALARWNLSDGGLRLPSDFIEVAERSGRIAELGRMVLHKTCLRAAAWGRSGLTTIPVSVNLSPFQFKSDGLVREIRDIIVDTGLEPYRLDLELTESGLMGNEHDAIEKLAELKAIGIRVSIDDFGTGYSSFAMLKDFPVDTVKLPKSFVEPLPGDIRASMVAEAVIDLAHNLHFTVVAEGVETFDQFIWLDHARCDHYQGYLFSPPLAPREFEDLLAKGLPAIVQ